MSLLRSFLMLQSRLHVIGLNVQQWPFVDQPREGGGGGVRGGGGGVGARGRQGCWQGGDCRGGGGGGGARRGRGGEAGRCAGG